MTGTTNKSRLTLADYEAKLKDLAEYENEIANERAKLKATYRRGQHPDWTNPVGWEWDRFGDGDWARERIHPWRKERKEDMWPSRRPYTPYPNTDDFRDPQFTKLQEEIASLERKVRDLKAEVIRLRVYEKTIKYILKAYRHFPSVRSAVKNLRLMIKLTINMIPEKE